MSLSINRLLILLVSGYVLVACSKKEPRYAEPFRPQVHFSPEKNWMNDPNGMVFYEGEYHLFYQYNPEGIRWGHMSWGHAVSTDLLHWEHLPLALAEEPDLMMYSGSAVVDWNNSTGFGEGGKPSLVAIYTARRPSDNEQTQHLAFSNDKGRTWTKFSGNPVLDHELADFRDPKVFWYADSSRWIMAVSLPTERKVAFYSSTDLKSWNHESDFGPLGAVKGIWECPDLFALPAGDGKKWVLVVNIGSESVAGGSGVQYFVGDFDGKRFVADDGIWQKKPAVSDLKIAKKLFDFEQGVSGWTVAGAAMLPQPVKGSFPGQGTVRQFGGKMLVNSWVNGDMSRGSMLSPEFELSNKYLHVKIGGGANADSVGVRLFVEGVEVGRISSKNSETLEWQTLKIGQYSGKKARVEIFDNAVGGWGYVLVDDVVLSDFPAENSPEPARWLDFAKDYYAAVSWSDIPPADGRRIMLGWMSNWLYGQDIPTQPWRSAMSLPREIALKKIENEWLVIQTPVREIERLRGEKLTIQKRIQNREEIIEVLEVDPQFEFSYELDVAGSTKNLALLTIESAGKVISKLQLDPVTKVVRIHRYDPRGDKLTLFNGVQTGAVFQSEKIKVRVFVDRSSVEVFLNDGEAVFTNLIFPDGKINLSAGSFGTLSPKNAVGWMLKSVW